MGEELIDKEYCHSMFSMIYQNISDHDDSDSILIKSTAWVLCNNPDLLEVSSILVEKFSDLSKAYRQWDIEKDAQKKFDVFLKIRIHILYIYSIFRKNFDKSESKKFYFEYQTKFNELMQERFLSIYPMLQNGIIGIENIKKDFLDIKNIDVFKERKKVKEFLKELDVAKQHADIVIGDIAENKNTGKYNEYYKECRKSAFWLFWASLAIMISTAITVTYNCVAYGMLDQSDFSGLLSRISLTALVLLPSFFMMREAKKLKDKEFQYYDMMCRIVTSAPYIDGLTHLDDNQKDQMKADLVKDFFARPIECRDDGGLVPIEEICKIIKVCNNE